MTRQWWSAVALYVALSGATLIAADPPKEPPKDTTAAAFTRTKKLKGTVAVEAKNLPLKEILLDISSQLDEQKLGTISAQYDIGISGNTRTSLSVKDVTAEEALDKLFGSLELGYVVVSKDKDRYDGWIKIVKGSARGYEPGMEPKDAPRPADPKKGDPKGPPKPAPTPGAKPDPKPEPTPDPAAEEDQKAASAKLEAARKLIADEKPEDAKKLLKYVVKFYPKAKATAEAKKLLDELK